MATVRYEKTRFSNIYKQCNLFVCQIVSRPNLLRFSHATLERAVAWRDKTKAKWTMQRLKAKCLELDRKTKQWMTIQKMKTKRQKYNQKMKVLLGRGKGRQPGDKRGATGRGYKTSPNAMAGALQEPPRTGMVCGCKRGIRGEGSRSMAQSGKLVQRDDNIAGHSSSSMQGEENLRDGSESTTRRRSRRIEFQRRSAL